MNKRILITGANGFVGTKLVNKLQTTEYEIEQISDEYGDIASCRLAFNNINHVIHLAARTFVPESWDAPMGFYQTNVMGTENVLEFCRKNNASLTFISSYVYGSPDILPISEEHALKAFNPYCHSKILAEDLCRFYAENFNVAVTILRPFNLYGPGQSPIFLIPEIIGQVLNPELGKIQLKSLKPKRDYVYIDDVIEAIVMTLNHARSSAYNVGSGYSVTVEEIVKMVMGITAIQKEIAPAGADRQNEVMDVVADISKIKNELSWTPATSLEAGLEKTIEHYTLIARKVE